MPDSRQAGPTGVRAAVERWSAVPVVFLHQLPRWVLLVAIFALLVVAMAVGGWAGAVAALALAAFLGWFAYLNWPRLDPGGRLLRVVALGALLALAAGHATGRF
ncbi:hypothetical protein DPM19_27445 [Actinomadura craniellae]|uniref:Uncharacterized protein n=1 Tax=Actinomadura craniellae TaxID=2231787 RepID=A0A365GZ52_9ACTN|nr:DUF6703 family protein [Actinomadura craniellae]RAY12076.1 hypothetical protein DPM19_27445 [Actinomadura craniellae]